MRISLKALRSAAREGRSEHTEYRTKVDSKKNPAVLVKGIAFDIGYLEYLVEYLEQRFRERNWPDTAKVDIIARR